jgi:hypothetical protein
MKYSFVKGYNQGYDFFLVEYFNQHGIEFGDKASFEEVFPRWVFASSNKNLSPEEQLFGRYVSRWRLHPEARPTYYRLFEKVMGWTGPPNVVQLRKLETELIDCNEKLVFSRDDFAAVISEFYRRYLRDPLRAELDRVMEE